MIDEAKELEHSPPVVSETSNSFVALKRGQFDNRSKRSLEVSAGVCKYGAPWLSKAFPINMIDEGRKVIDPLGAAEFSEFLMTTS